MTRSDTEALAAAALTWNRARLHRIAAAKSVPQTLFAHLTPAARALADARKAEAKALAALRKACTAADPLARVIDVQARTMHTGALPTLANAQHRRGFI